jgi:pentatricopeptide repeat protein
MRTGSRRSMAISGLAQEEQPENCVEVYGKMKNREYPKLIAMFKWQD